MKSKLTTTINRNLMLRIRNIAIKNNMDISELIDLALSSRKEVPELVGKDKVSIMMDDEAIMQLKLEAVRQGVRINNLMEAQLQSFFRAYDAGKISLKKEQDKGDVVCELKKQMQR